MFNCKVHSFVSTKKKSLYRNYLPGQLLLGKSKLHIVDAGKVRLPPGETLNINKKIKHISNWNFELKMVPVNAERFKLSKYMCVCPKRSFVARTGRTKVKLTPKIGAKIKKSFIKQCRHDYLLI